MGLFCCSSGSKSKARKHDRLEETPRETPQHNYNNQTNNYNPYADIRMDRDIPVRGNNNNEYNNRHNMPLPPRSYANNAYNNLNLINSGGGGSSNGGSRSGARAVPSPPMRQLRTPEPKNDNLFPELADVRLDETEVLLTRKISTGAFGVVWLGHFHGQPVAVKRMIEGGEEVSFSREIQTMARLTHPKIVHFIGCTWTSVKDLSAVTEYMDGGDVRSLLENRKIELSWKQEKISIAIDIAEALAFMHSLSPKVIHRDLKSRNVLLSAQLVAKLSDFGLSRNRTYEETLTAGVGTVRWTAPEVMLGENYSEQADVYSFGVVLSELDTREIPFEEKGTSRSGAPAAPDMAIVIKVARGELRPTFSPDCPEPIDKIAKMCLQFDQALRPSAATIVRMLNDAKKQILWLQTVQM